MSKPITPTRRTLPLLTDPRSTGTPPRYRLVDILGLKGTRRSRARG